jgi:hypothetical protein
MKGDERDMRGRSYISGMSNEVGENGEKEMRRQDGRV